MKSIKLFLVLLNILSSSSLLGQTFSLDWVKQITGVRNEQGSGITLDATGNIYVTGVFTGTPDFDPGPGTFTLTSPTISDQDIFVAKYDPAGNFIWAAQIGGGGTQESRAIALDPLGNIYVTGWFRGLCDFDPGSGSFTIGPISTQDIFILKLDNDGNFFWVKHIASPVSEFGNSIAADAAGNVFVTGEFGGPTDFDPGAGTTTLSPLGSFDIFVLKLDTDGNFIFAFALGDSGQDRGNYISVDGSNNFYLTGFYRSTVDFDPGVGTTNLTASGTSSDVFVAKFDASANLLWVRGIGFTQGDEGHSVIASSGGEVVVSGIFRQTVDFDPSPSVFNLTAVSAGSIFDLVLSGSGDFISASARLGNSVSDIGNFATTDASGNLYKTGEFSSTVDFDPGPGVVNLTATALDMFIVKLVPSTVAPTITNFTPTSGAIGTTVTITGTNFSTIPANNTVQFNGTTAVVSASSPTSITTTVPIGTTTGTISVTVGGNTATSATDFTILPAALPTITSFTPATGSIGTTVVITGTNFSATPSNNTVMFNGTTAIVTASTTTTITTTVPSGTTTGKISVTVASNTATSATDFTITTAPTPTIISFTPTSGPIGTNVTIMGTNFSTIPVNNTVKFNGTTSVIAASTATSITTTVPAGTTTGKISLTVAGNTATSATDFTITTISNQPPVINATEATVPIAGSTSIDLTLLISDIDNNLDLTTLKIVNQPSSGALAQITNNVLSIDYIGLNFSGQDRITIEVCDLSGSCTQQELIIEVVGYLNIYTGISPNGDIYNEKWVIQNIELLPDTRENKVSIYNRWGDLVFEIEDYDNDTRVFSGVNKNGDEVSSGVYFYKIEFLSGKKPLLGYLNVKQ